MTIALLQQKPFGVPVLARRALEPLRASGLFPGLYALLLLLVLAQLVEVAILDQLLRLGLVGPAFSMPAAILLLVI